MKSGNNTKSGGRSSGGFKKGGSFGKGGYSFVRKATDDPNLIYGRLGRAKSTGKDWALVAICPVEYAVFDKENRIFETVYNTYESLPDMFDACVVYANSSTFNKL